jgi:hypothetical protein
MTAVQLTEREGVRYQQGRRDMLEDLIVEFDRYAGDPHGFGPTPDELPDSASASWALDKLRQAAERIDRITGPLELPEAACAVGTVRRGEPLLCGREAGHPGRHAWEWIPPAPPQGPWWRRLFSR